jgi:hypothetical protein
MESPPLPALPEDRPVVIPQETIGKEQWSYQPDWNEEEYIRRGKKEQFASIKRFLKAVGALACLTVFANLTVAVIIFILLGPEIMQHLYQSSTVLFVITPAIVPIFAIEGAALVAYFAFIIFAITFSFTYLVGSSFLQTVKETLTGKPGRHSWILMVGGLSLASLFVTEVSYFLVGAAGISPNVPSFGSEPIWSQVYGYAEASVWEEIVSRLLLIGVPLLWIDLIFRRKKLLAPQKYFLGGMKRYGPVEVCLVIFSGLMFGFAHAYNWDIFKVIPTVVGGFCFGYIFLTVGLHGSIVFHMSFNLLSVPALFLSSGYTVALGLAIIFFWLPMGFMFGIYWLLRLGKFFNKKPARDNPVQPVLPVT